MGVVSRLIGATALVACTMIASAAEAATKIEFFFPVPVEGKLAREMGNIVKRFNAGQKDVEVVPVYTGNYDETKIKSQAAVQAGKPPGVALMSANFVLDFKIADQIVPLDPLLAADGTTREKFLTDFWPALHSNAMADGKLYAIPFHNSTPLLYYNAEHFKEAGLDPEKPPQTWAEMVEIAKKLTKREGGKVERWGVMMPGNYDYLGWLVTAFAMSNGGQYYNPEFGGEVYYDTPSTVGAVRFFDDLVRKHGVMPAGVTDATQVSSSFFAGKASMVVLSTGSLSFIRENTKFKYDVAFVPRHLRNAVAIGGASLITFKGLPPDQQKAAWTFMKWITSADELGSWSRFTGYFSPRKSSYEMTEMKEFISKNPDALTALQQLQFAQPWFATYNTVGVRKALEDEVQAVLSGKKTPDDAMREAQKKANEIMKPYNDSTALNLPK
jgi:sn-glycerol 3-phosphate transport system substrate-binding protein